MACRRFSGMRTAMSVYLRFPYDRQIGSANHITMIHPTLHPDRVLKEHDFLYMLDGTWEIGEELPAGGQKEVFRLRTDDLLILPAGRHHYGLTPCSPHNRHMYIHAKPLKEEIAANTGKTAGAGGNPADPADGKPTGPAGGNPEGPADSNPAGPADGNPAGPADGNPADGLTSFSSLIHCQDAPRIRSLFEEIISESWTDSGLKKQKLSLLFNLLLCELLEQQEKEEIQPGAATLVDEVSRLIQSTPQTFFTGKELAERFYVCERTLTNHFKRAFGKTLYAYQMDLKLEMVRQFLLTQPDVKLHETALNFGFCDEFHLSRAFRRKYGLSPDQYRRKNS